MSVSFYVSLNMAFQMSSFYRDNLYCDFKLNHAEAVPFLESSEFHLA